MLYNPREPHERHGENAGGDEGDWGAFHALGRLHQVDVLTDAREDDQGKGETEGDANGIDDRLAKVQQCGGFTFNKGEFLGDHGQRNAKDGAVGRNQWQEHAQSGVERRTDFLQDNLHHLHQGSDDENESDGLQELVQAQRDEQVLVHKPSYQSGQGQHEDDGGTHTQGCGSLL